MLVSSQNNAFKGYKSQMHSIDVDFFGKRFKSRDSARRVPSLNGSGTREIVRFLNLQHFKINDPIAPNSTSPPSKMANHWVLVAGAAVIAILTFGIPRLLAEYFPWQSLRAQRHGRPTVTTKSYKGRTVLITGANGAFGSRAAKIFAHRGVATLVLADVKDCGGVKDEIEAELREMQKPVPNILVWQIDMMSFAGCQELGKMARELENLDHVLLTAGILSFNRRESPEGWETSKCPSPQPRNLPLL